MDGQSVIETLRRHKYDLNRQGVVHAAVFGSVARGDTHAGSDIDILIDIDPDTHLSVFDYVGLKEYIAGLFDGPVDVVSAQGLKPYLRRVVQAEKIYAF